jgi:hypothetical protein
MGRLTLLGAGGVGTVGTAPVNTVAPVISGTNVVGNILTVTTGTWTGSPAPTFEYWWKRDGVPVTPIPTPGATTYNLTQLDAGYNITCEVYATNPSGTASAVSNTIFVYDADAYAFDSAELAAGVTLNTTQRNAINELVINLKNANLWTKMMAIYPIIGGTATSHKFNLKNPLDTNAAFRLSFLGGWTHSATGITGNGGGISNTYANTYLSTSMIGLSNGHISYYSRTNNTYAAVEIGGGNPSPDSYTLMGLRSTHSPGTTAIWFNNTVSYNTTPGVDTSGFFCGTRTGNTTIRLFRNGQRIIDGTAVVNTTSIYPLFIGGYNGSGSLFNANNRECSFASIGTGLTELENQVFNQIVELYQYTLGRSVLPAQSFYYNRNYGNTVNAFLYSTQVTDATTQQAVAQLVSDLTGYGIWSKMKAIYPMVGTTATQQKFNLVNSQDTDAAFRLNFVGGWTHSSLGATPNGTNAYANTYLIPTSKLTNNSTHYSYYSRSNTVGPMLDMGCSGSSPDQFNLWLRYTAPGYDGFFSHQYNFNVNSINVITNTDSRGFYIGTRTSSIVHKAYKNGLQIGTTDTATSTGFANQAVPVVLANRADLPAGFYSNRQCAFSSIGDGLTDTEAANFSTAVNTFQTTLGRNVY